MSASAETAARAEGETRPDAPLIAALDVGVSKTVCLATRRDPVLDMHPNRPLRVLGVGVQSAPASASGRAADFETCARAIHVAIDEAAFMAGAPIRRVTAAYAGPGVGAAIVRGSVRVRGRKIGDAEVEAALAAASAAGADKQNIALHVEPLRYFVDDDATLDPYGASGRMLTAEACVVTAPAAAIAALRACVRAAGAEVEEVVAAPYVIGMAALSTEERDEGALVIDLGAGALGIAVFAAEGLVHAETAPIGGVRLTRDLAVNLGTTFAAAERIKLAYGAVGGGFNPREAVAAPRLGEDGRLEAAAVLRGAIADILAPRQHDILLTARARLAKAGFSGAAGPGRAVLVGGGALLPGIKEAAAEALGVPVRIGRLADLSGFEHGEAGPAYAAAAGALRWRLDTPTLEDVEASFTPSLKAAAAALRNAAGDAARWLTRNF